MKALVFDTETNGVDFSNMQLLEISWAILHIESMELIKVGGGIVNSGVEENPAEHINHISPSILQHGTPVVHMLKFFQHDLSQVDHVLAHNIQFDVDVCEVVSKRIGMNIVWPNKVCTFNDYSWPEIVTGRKVTHMATDLGITVKNAHRALYDVLMLCECLQKCGSALFLKVVSSNKVEIVADVDFQNKDKAKQKGFSWNPECKKWCKNILLSEEEMVDISSILEGYAREYGFNVVVKK